MKTKSILLIGLGRFGRHLASRLIELGHQVMAVDNDEERVNDISNVVTNSQIGNSANEDFLKSLGVSNFDVCIVTISGDFQASLETTCLLKELGAKKVVSRAERDGQAKLLLRNGADEVVYPEKQLAQWIAIKYSSDNIIDYIEIDDHHAIFEIKIPKSWVGKSVIQIDIRKKYNINIMGVKQNGKINLEITPNLVFHEGQSILVLGEHKLIQKIFKL